MKEIKPGRYQHYKGGFEEVIGVGRHTETLEEMVIYRTLYDSGFGKGALWVRPKKMFLEKVKWDGKVVPRFKKVK
jgi:cyclomaltodextrinase / maltogenic alpha-amylase / neopullulanase